MVYLPNQPPSSINKENNVKYSIPESLVVDLPEPCLFLQDFLTVFYIKL